MEPTYIRLVIRGEPTYIRPVLVDGDGAVPRVHLARLRHFSRQPRRRRLDLGLQPLHARLHHDAVDAERQRDGRAERNGRHRQARPPRQPGHVVHALQHPLGGADGGEVGREVVRERGGGLRGVAAAGGAGRRGGREGVDEDAGGHGPPLLMVDPREGQVTRPKHLKREMNDRSLTGQ